MNLPTKTAAAPAYVRPPQISVERISQRDFEEVLECKAWGPEHGHVAWFSTDVLDVSVVAAEQAIYKLLNFGQWIQNIQVYGTEAGLDQGSFIQVVLRYSPS